MKKIYRLSPFVLILLSACVPVAASLEVTPTPLPVRSTQTLTPSATYTEAPSATSTKTSTPEPVQLQDVMPVYVGIHSWGDINPDDGIIKNWMGAEGPQDEFNKGSCHWTADQHSGYDFLAYPGTRVFAPFSGEISRIQFNETQNGYILEINHGYGRTSEFSHIIPVASEADIEIGTLQEFIDAGFISENGEILDETGLENIGYKILYVGDTVNVGDEIAFSIGHYDEGQTLLDVGNGGFNTWETPRWIMFYRYDDPDLRKNFGIPEWMNIDPCYYELWEPSVYEQICSLEMHPPCNDE